MKTKRLICLALLTLILGCSDFTNSKRSTGPTASPPAKPGGSNPFPKDYNPNEGAFSEAKMLANIGLSLLAPKVMALRLETELMNARVCKYCDALTEGIGVDAAKTAAQNQWKTAMLAYHAVAAVPVGPISDRRNTLGDRIYSWPNVGVCSIDVQVEKISSSGKASEQIVFSAAGLAAIEYLLYEPALGSACDLTSPIFKKILDWTNRSPSEKSLDRCKLAARLANDTLVATRELEEVWAPERGNFSKTLIDGSRYPSIKEAVTAMSDAIFDIEDTKDFRLGKPLGLNKDCRNSSGKCPEMSEHPWSGLAIQAVAARLQSAREAFFGAKDEKTAAFGFDDYLINVGHPEVVESISRGLSDVIASIEQADHVATFQQQVEGMNKTLCRSTQSDSRLVEICAVYQDLRAVVIEMKTDFLTALSLRSPPGHAGDAD